jgi:hypothetical protein
MRTESKKMSVILVAVFALLVGLAVTLRAADLYQENFDANWVNDTATGRLDEKGTFPEAWAFRLHGAGMWLMVDAPEPQKKVLQFKGESFNNGWWSGGGRHGVVCPAGKTIQLDGWIREATPAKNVDIAYLWLSTPEQNGYGLVAIRSNAYEHSNDLNDNKNYVTLVKYRDNTVKFGENPTCDWKTQDGDRPKAPVAVETANDGYLHYFLQLKQKAAGAPVEIALFYKDTKNPPVMTWTDDGTQFGPVIDVSNLSHVGVTAENGKDHPHAIQYDAIGVALLP